MPGKALAKRFLRKAFEVGQMAGVDLLPRHFYSAIPDVRALRRSTAWREPRGLISVRGAEISAQAAAFETCFDGRMLDVLRARDIWADACHANGAIGYGPVEADVLFAYIAHHQPPRVIQIGAGVSTAVTLAAARFAGYQPQLVCIDPYPTTFLEERARAGDIELVAKPAEEVAAGQLADVGTSGLLFIDSTHTVKPGSEVNQVILDVLPRLPASSRAHFHDITLPYDYPPDILSSALFFWNETALLLAFLSGNDRASIHFSLSMLHHAQPSTLTHSLPRYQAALFDQGVRISEGHFPSSTYVAIS
jgi:hypothetical protein